MTLPRCPGTWPAASASACERPWSANSRVRRSSHEVASRHTLNHPCRSRHSVRKKIAWAALMVELLVVASLP